MGKNVILLNPGDRIYDVYRSAIWFDDERYNVIDYYSSHDNEVEEDDEYQLIKISSHIDKAEAESIAELLHQQIMQKHHVSSFNQEKLNPDFQAKQWCQSNNIPYKDEWNSLTNWEIHDRILNFLYETENYQLIDKFDRARYLYRIDNIETWCRDNNFPYDKNLDNWGNWHRLWNYLQNPENINLLSKFWKDTVGSFAFVHEEIIQEKTYLKIEKDR